MVDFNCNSATQKEAVYLCKLIYEKLSVVGFYPALTGGLLYKGDNRKDIDILIFRNRQHAKFEMEDIKDYLEPCGLTDFKFYGFVTKCKYKGLVVDLFNPETSIEFDEDEEYGG